MIIFLLHVRKLRPKDGCDVAKVTELVCAEAAALSLRGNQDHQKADLLSLSVSTAFSDSLNKLVLSTSSSPHPVLGRLRRAHSPGEEMHGPSSSYHRAPGCSGASPTGGGRCKLCEPSSGSPGQSWAEPWDPGSCEVGPGQGRHQGRDAVETHTVVGGLHSWHLTEGHWDWVRSRRGPQHRGELGAWGCGRGWWGQGRQRKGRGLQKAQTLQKLSGRGLAWDLPVILSSSLHRLVFGLLAIPASPSGGVSSGAGVRLKELEVAGQGWAGACRVPSSGRPCGGSWRWGWGSSMGRGLQQSLPATSVHPSGEEM